MLKVILPEKVSRRHELQFSDERWARITSTIPKRLPAEIDARLRSAVMACCSWFLTQQAHLQEGAATAAAMRKPGKRQLAPLERLVNGLRMAADAWKEISKLDDSRTAGNRRYKIHDDRLGDIGMYEDLEAMARDSERRLAGIRQLGKPITMIGPWPVFVRKVAQCFRQIGITPTVTGRVYSSSWGTRPSWFQKFMAELNENLLGDEGKGKQLKYSRPAFYAEVAKTMRGDRKPDKARK
jgi:hypothetical protein